MSDATLRLGDGLPTNEGGLLASLRLRNRITPEPGILVWGRSYDCSPIPVTSISVAWVPATVAGCCDTLRLYGIEMGDVQEGFAYGGEGCPLFDAAPFLPYGELPDCDTSDPFELVTYTNGERDLDARVRYLDAVETDYEDRPPEFDFWLRSYADRGGGPLLQTTCVPKHRGFPTFYLITHDYSCPGGGDERRLEAGPAVQYQDGVDVVPLPDGRWLMLMHCRTVLVNDYASMSSDEIRTAATGLEPRACIMSDIVCYVADDAGFTRGLLGPFRVVDSKAALPLSELPSELCVYRLFTGVPSGVVIDDYLYVYYSVDTSLNFDDGCGDDPDECAMCPEGTYGRDAATSRDAYVAAFREIFPKGGLAVKRIALTDLYAAFDPPTSLDLAFATATHVWDYMLYNAGHDVTIPGDLLGRVRLSIWAPDEVDWA